MFLFLYSVRKVYFALLIQLLSSGTTFSPILRTRLRCQKVRGRVMEERRTSVTRTMDVA
jgi:hypothetical protein